MSRCRGRSVAYWSVTTVVDIERASIVLRKLRQLSCGAKLAGRHLATMDGEFTGATIREVEVAA
jgi:hypothetical protein